MLGPVRYRIVGLIFLLALINHIDRANISIAAPVMMRELGWSEALFGVIFSAFLWGYTVVQLPGGYIADRYGGKMIPYLCLGWSIATLLTPLGASAFWLMLVLRFLVGAFEAPIVPAMSITNAAWVPRHELARAQTDHSCRIECRDYAWLSVSDGRNRGVRLACGLLSLWRHWYCLGIYLDVGWSRHTGRTSLSLAEGAGVYSSRTGETGV